MNLEDLLAAIRQQRLSIADRADEAIQSERLYFDEVFFSVLQGQLVADYSTGKPYATGLIAGHTFAKVPVHSVWAYDPANRWAMLLTVYRHNPEGN